MWVKFTDDFDWKPSSAVTVAYKKGMTLNVPRNCGTAAIAEEKAVAMRKAKKDMEPIEWQGDPEQQASTSE